MVSWENWEKAEDTAYGKMRTRVQCEKRLDIGWVGFCMVETSECAVSCRPGWSLPGEGRRTTLARDVVRKRGTFLRGKAPGGERALRRAQPRTPPQVGAILFFLPASPLHFPLEVEGGGQT